MNEQERKVVLEQLDASRDRLLGLVRGLTLEQWAFQPGEGRWSISECLEHVMRVENRVTGFMGKKLEGPPELEKKGAGAEQDAMIARAIRDRTNRREAPAPARPVAEWPDPDELVAQFQATRERTARFAAATNGDLRNYFIPHMALGELDCYQWLIVLGLHGERHALQIEEIKAADGFPATAG